MQTPQYMNNSSEFSSKNIFRLAKEILRDYKKPFFYSQLLGGLLFLIIAFCSISLLVFLESPLLINITVNNENLSFLFTLQDIFGIIIFLPSFIVLFAFSGSLFGMAHEILTGGDYYIELKSTFHYFKQYWWQYFIIVLCLFSWSYIFGGFFVSDVENVNQPSVSFQIFGLIIEFFWLLFFILWGPSLTHLGKMKESFRQNVKLVRKYFSQILKTIGVLNLILTCIDLLFAYVLIPISMTAIWLEILISILNLIYLGAIFFIFFPYFAIVATCVYLHLNKTEKIVLSN